MPTRTTRTTESTVYIASVFGIDTDGNPTTFWLQKDPIICGANPINWNTYPHEFAFNDIEEMRQACAYAAGSYRLRSRDLSTVTITRRKRTVRTVTEEEVVE